MVRTKTDKIETLVRLVLEDNADTSSNTNMKNVPLFVLQGAKAVDHITQRFKQPMINSLKAQGIHFDK